MESFDQSLKYLLQHQPADFNVGRDSAFAGPFIRFALGDPAVIIIAPLPSGWPARGRDVDGGYLVARGEERLVVHIEFHRRHQSLEDLAIDVAEAQIRMFRRERVPVCSLVWDLYGKPEEPVVESRTLGFGMPRERGCSQCVYQRVNLRGLGWEQFMSSAPAALWPLVPLTRDGANEMAIMRARDAIEGRTELRPAERADQPAVLAFMAGAERLPLELVKSWPGKGTAGGPEGHPAGGAMIKSDAELQQVIEQMGRLYRALASIRADVKESNPRLFAVMAEGPMDELARFQREVEEYVGLSDLRDEQADVWLRIHGPEVAWERAPTSTLTALMDAFRKGVQVVAEWLDTGTLTTRPTKELQDACDLRLVGLLPGSVQVGLRLPDLEDEEEEATTSKRKIAERALQTYLEVAAWTSDAQASLEERIPDEHERRVLLTAVKPLLPRKRGSVELVEIRGRRVSGNRVVRLTRESHARLDQELDRLVRERIETRTGTLREIDLDSATFVVRDEETGSAVKCVFADEFYERAKDALDRLVLVSGPIRRWGSRREAAELQVTRLEIPGEELLDGEGEES